MLASSDLCREVGTEVHYSWWVLPAEIRVRWHQDWAVVVSSLSFSVVQMHPVLQAVPVLISEVYVLNYFFSFDPPRLAGSHLRQHWGQPRVLPKIALLGLKATSLATHWPLQPLSPRHGLLLVHGSRLQKFTKLKSHEIVPCYKLWHL